MCYKNLENKNAEVEAWLVKFQWEVSGLFAILNSDSVVLVNMG